MLLLTRFRTVASFLNKQEKEELSCDSTFIYVSLMEKTNIYQDGLCVLSRRFRYGICSHVGSCFSCQTRIGNESAHDITPSLDRRGPDTPKTPPRARKSKKGRDRLACLLCTFFSAFSFFFHQLMKLFTLTAIATALFAVSDAAMTR